ncbi:MAG: sugar phosphate isomerase/epimerase [Ruminococcaceae bacterium]|nr:sugar phosphate isomerase/epimerase [Oscillospiraceae bacterium]
MKFGLNLYSLRKQIATREDFYNTLCRLKELGYDYVQYSGAPFDGEMIREVSEKAGVPVVLTHVPFDRIMNDTEALVAEHKLFGCNRVGLGAMKFKGLTEEEMLDNIAQVGEASRRVTAAGGRFFYHNHNFEFQRLSTGETIYDRMLTALPEVNFTLDTYWLQSGGVSILEYIKKSAGRICCVHLKDYLPTFPEGNFKAKFAPVGEGNINWHDVIPAFAAAGAEYYLVEQDDATDYEDPFREVGSSIAYLKKNFG